MFLLSSETVHRIVELTDQWCMTYLGESPKLVIEITKQKFWKSPCFGGYDENNKVMYVYVNRCENIKDLLKVFIHEYTHHLQDLSQYDSLLELYGYDNHPLEIEANEMAEYYNIVWKEIKNKI